MHTYYIIFQKRKIGDSIFKLRTEAYTSTIDLITDWPTDWLNDSSVRIINLSTVITVLTWWESPTRCEKSIRTRSLEAKLEQLCYIVILKCYSMFFLIIPYFHTFHWHLFVRQSSAFEQYNLWFRFYNIITWCYRKYKYQVITVCIS